MKTDRLNEFLQRNHENPWTLVEGAVSCIKQYEGMYFDPDNQDFYDNVLDMEICLDNFKKKNMITDFRVCFFVILVCCFMYYF